MFHVQARANKQYRTAFENDLDTRSLAVVVEDYQLYTEYLDALETAPLQPVKESITVTIGGQAVKFQSADDFAGWLAENMT